MKFFDENGNYVGEFILESIGEVKEKTQESFENGSWPLALIFLFILAPGWVILGGFIYIIVQFIRVLFWILSLPFRLLWKLLKLLPKGLWLLLKWTGIVSWWLLKWMAIGLLWLLKWTAIGLLWMLKWIVIGLWWLIKLIARTLWWLIKLPFVIIFIKKLPQF